jgi:hypothetical protein
MIQHFLINRPLLGRNALITLLETKIPSVCRLHFWDVASPCVQHYYDSATCDAVPCCAISAVLTTLSRVSHEPYRAVPSALCLQHYCELQVTPGTHAIVHPSLPSSTPGTMLINPILMNIGNTQAQGFSSTLASSDPPAQRPCFPECASPSIVSQ